MDSLVHRRPKRSTAGNRLRALLDKAHAIDAESGYEEPEDDIDFEDKLDQGDVFDDDFASTDDEAVDDDLEGARVDKSLRIQEKQDRRAQKKKHFHDPFAYMKNGQRSAPIASDSQGEPSAKRPRLEDVDETVPLEEDDEDASGPTTETPEIEEATPGSGTSISTKGKSSEVAELRRSILRASTRKDREEVDERVELDEAKRALNPLRGPKKIHPDIALTQADLIALALEREEENRESLKDWLKKEEERRLKAREGRKALLGPRITWISRRVETRETAVQEKLPITSATNHSDIIPPNATGPSVVSTGTPLPIPKPVTSQEPTFVVPSVLPHLPASPVASSSSTIDHDMPAYMKPTAPITIVEDDTSTDIMTISHDQTSLILQEIEGGQQAELTAIFGDHADWTRIPFVSLRNRSITRRKPICPFTGKPANYRHPSTLIPYATAEAFQKVDKILNGAYRWSSANHVYLGQVGTGEVETEGLEAATGVIEEVPGWAEAVGWRTAAVAGEDAAEPVDSGTSVMLDPTAGPSIASP